MFGITKQSPAHERARVGSARANEWETVSGVWHVKWRITRSLECASGTVLFISSPSQKMTHDTAQYNLTKRSTHRIPMQRVCSSCALNLHILESSYTHSYFSTLYWRAGHPPGRDQPEDGHNRYPTDLALKQDLKTAPLTHVEPTHPTSLPSDPLILRRSSSPPSQRHRTHLRKNRRLKHGKQCHFNRTTSQSPHDWNFIRSLITWGSGFRPAFFWYSPSARPLPPRRSLQSLPHRRDISAENLELPKGVWLDFGTI